MRQLKLFYRFFLVAIWLGMFHFSSLQIQAQEVYLFEDFEEAGADVLIPDDNRQPPEGWTTYFLTDSTNNWLSEFFRFRNDASTWRPQPFYPVEGKIAYYSSSLAPVNGGEDNTALESPEFDLPATGTPVFLTFDHQFDYITNNADGLVELWNGINWQVIYQISSKDVGFNSDTTLNKIAIENVDLSDYIQELDNTKVRFRYIEDRESGSMWVIDNVKVFTPPTIDIGLININHTALPYHCYTENESLTLELKNYGLDLLDFSKTPFQLIVNCKGVIEKNYAFTIEEGLINTNQTHSIEVSGIDFSQSGSYRIEAVATMMGDETLKNDTIRLYRHKSAAPFLPLPVLGTSDYTYEQGREDGWSYSDLGGFAASSYVDATHPNGESLATFLGLGYQGSIGVATPKFIATEYMELSFDMALVFLNGGDIVHTATTNFLGSENPILIKISTDCGLSYETIHEISGEKGIYYEGQTEHIRIEGYGGQEVIVSIGMRENAPLEEFYHFSIDNIQIKEVLNRDIALELLPDFILGAYEDYGFQQIADNGWFVCGDFDYPVRVKMVNRGAVLQNNFEVVGNIRFGWNDDFSLLITEPLYPEEERILTLGTTNTYNGGQFDFEAYIRLPNDDDHSNDTLDAFLVAFSGIPNASFVVNDLSNGSFRFDAFHQTSHPYFEWNFGDGTTTEGYHNIVEHNYQSAGTYTIQLTVTDECGTNTETKTVVVGDIVNIETKEWKESIQLYPNPTDSSIRLQMENRGISDAVVKVLDVNGRTIYQQSHSFLQETSIDLKNQPNGVYYFQIQTQDKFFYKKIILNQTN